MTSHITGLVRTRIGSKTRVRAPVMAAMDVTGRQAGRRVLKTDYRLNFSDLLDFREKT